MIDEAVRERIHRFRFLAPRYAQRVAVVGDFNGWNRTSHLMQPVSSGMWELRVAIPPGRHEYKFFVNGEEWFRDPAAAQFAPNDFGSANSILEIDDIYEDATTRRDGP